MLVSEYPKFTIIMRGYTYQQAEVILQAMVGVENQFAVEMTLNTPNAIENITKLNDKYGGEIKIGAGTVRNFEQAKQAAAAGAQFLLGPHVFTEEMIAYAHQQKIVAVPAAMTPSEVNEMFALGADIVKIFPAAVVSPRFFKDIQAPLGDLPLMGVGGISKKNAKEFFANGASYLGIGSGLFAKTDIESLNVHNLAKSLQALIAAV